MKVRGSESVCGLSRNPLFCACARPFRCPARSHWELTAAMRVKCDLLFGFHLASWTAADLITAHCVHTHKPISTLQDKQQMQILLCRVIVIQDNLRTGHDINSGVPHRWKMYMFPWPVLFLWTMCERASRHLISFRPLSMLTQPCTETTGADCMPLD